MNKELEAFKRIWAMFDFKDMQYERSLVIKALTPPTVDEVIKALSDYYGREVVFRENVFWYKTIIYDNEQWVREVSLKDLSKDNRGDLIEMIGKFYESLKRETHGVST